MNYSKIPLPDDMNTLVKFLGIGLDESLIRQLINKSKQKHIIENTPNDAAKRFTTVQAFYNWYGTNHIVHWLIGEDNDLAGILWYSVKKFPLEQMPINEYPSETFAIRLYEGYVGQHLAVPFMKFSLKVAIDEKLKHNMEVPDMWLKTTPNNYAAIASYAKLGYKELFKDDSSIIMTVPASHLKSLVMDVN